MNLASPIARAAVLGAASLLLQLALGLAASAGADAAYPDTPAYIAMATRPFSGDPWVHMAPFCWRVLPSLMVWATSLEPRTGFHLLTLLAAALVPGAVVALLRALSFSTSTAFAAGVLVVLSPAFIGYAAWDFVRTDAVALLLLVLSLWACVTSRPFVFGVLLVALALTKETWILAAAFALTWPDTRRRHDLPAAILACGLAAAAAVTIRLIVEPAQPYSPLENFRSLYLPLEWRTVARRLLLATAGTWNVLTPLIVIALVRARRTREGSALTLPLVLAMLQIAVAIDTQRIVAAAYPFVLILLASLGEHAQSRTRAQWTVGLALGQIPWLLSYATIWDSPLRAVEIAIALTACGCACWAWPHAIARLPLRVAALR